eukprot:TRINITY_DN16330_c0_g1_i1.p1 TRINITY_DN16330_c0_g1~~TRINITY_DN16330_c0_g1_i1.p1  ORF type:complete len:563 (+),score=127.81 TRINITY_DN16330_c0_g1_i1:135-1691(+)
MAVLPLAAAAAPAGIASSGQRRFVRSVLFVGLASRLGMRQPAVSPLLPLLLASLPRGWGALSLPRGLGPLAKEAAGKHASAISAGSFRCFDGTGSERPLSIVNDDFCDCADGSDEPGTAACVTGSGAGGWLQPAHNSPVDTSETAGLFFCRNKGSQAEYIFLSRVGDGLCDCCDGSDEWVSGNRSGACEDRCEEHGRENREVAQKQRVNWEHGTRFQLELLKEWDASVEERRRQVAELEKAMPALTQRAAEARKASDDADAKVPDGSPTSPTTSTVAATPADGAETPQVSEYAKWMDHDGVKDEAKDSGVAPAAVTTAMPPFDTVDVDKDGVISREEYEKVATGATATPVVKSPEMVAAEKEKEAAHKELREAKHRLWNLKAGLHPGLKGNARALAGLAESCPAAKVGEQTYKICFFRNAEQSTDTEKELSLGRWIGWKFDPAGGLPKGQFERGTKCGNGVQRRLTVSFECGKEAEIVSTSEPSVCVYEAVVAHPGACDPAVAPDYVKLKPKMPRDEL